MKNQRAFYSLGVVLLLPVLLFQNQSPTTKKFVGKNVVEPPVTVSKETEIAGVIGFAEAFKATLNKDQLALLQLDYTKKNAVRWSNFPQKFSNPNRVGLGLSTLNATQFAAFKTLMGAVLAQNMLNEGYDELEGVRVADDYLGKNTNQSATFGGGNYYIAFLGKPSETGLWELQYGGHHFAFSNTYNQGKITGATPSFRGTEPMKLLTANGRTYQPLEQEREAFANLITALTEAEKTPAKLTTTFTDVILGPGEDSQFPAKKVGIKISSLNAVQQKLIINAIALYVDDLDPATAKKIMQKYVSELPETYVAYSGTGTMEQVADYIRIDGPTIWIEYAVQPSRDFPNTTHPHSIWRDHKSDYGGN